MLSCDSRGDEAGMVCVGKHVVTLFLLQAKALIQDGSTAISSRKENADAVTQLGLLHVHQLEILLGLTYREYFNTLPETDKDGEAWEFGVVEQGRTIYIKLSIKGPDDKTKYVDCISFHLATAAINYPYRT
jgi:hypothetical protein